MGEWVLRADGRGIGGWGGDEEGERFTPKEIRQCGFHINFLNSVLFIKNFNHLFFFNNR